MIEKEEEEEEATNARTGPTLLACSAKSCMCGGNLNFIFENDLMRRKVNLSCLTDIERDTTF